MNQDPESPVAQGHPLAGVLDRLLARERGTFGSPVPRPARNRPPAVERVESTPLPDPASRRMLVVAALGADAGAGAVRSVVRWALDSGLHPAVLDIGSPDGLGSLGAAAEQRPPSGPRVPLANLPAAPESLKDQPAEILAALLERLRRYESSTGLLALRIVPSYRMALMRAAFLAGGLIVPVEESPDSLREALRLSRELLESFIDVSVWPYAADPDVLQRYQALMLEFLGAETDALELAPSSADGILSVLSSPPHEGFLVSLVDPDTPSPPAQLLQLGSMTI